MGILARIFGWFRRWSAPAISTAARPAAKRSNSALANREDEGVYYYLGDVLDRINDSHRLLRAMRRVDPEAYDYHSRVGARVTPKNALFKWGTPSRFPTIGMVFMAPVHETRSSVDANFFYFEKIERPWNVEPSPLPVYRMCVAYFGKCRRAAVSQFHVAVGEHGGRVLREAGVETVMIRHRHKNERTTLHRPAWVYPPMLLDAHKRNAKGETLDEFATNALGMAVHSFADPADEELQIRCRKGSTTAMLTVSTKRTPYFFKDRGFEAASDGRRKRIFHHVAAHTRTMADGSTVDVKEHYRGARRFEWGGNAVTITVPGLHHKPLSDMEFSGMQTEPGAPIPRGALDSKGFGKRLDDRMTDS